MSFFKTSTPRSTSFSSGFKKTSLSYKGIPKEYPSGDKIPRAERLRIAKEVRKIKSEEAVYDVYDREGNYMKSFTKENEAKNYSQGFEGAQVMKRMKDEIMKAQVNELDRERQEKEYNEHSESEGREVLGQTLSL